VRAWEVALRTMFVVSAIVTAVELFVQAIIAVIRPTQLVRAVSG
jgi:hypothetical protein